MKRFLFLIVAISFMNSCKESSDDVTIGSHISPHFISAYLVPTKIEVLSNAPGHLYLSATGEVYKTSANKGSANYDKVQYFSNLYGDTSYNRASQSFNNALAYPIDKITIYCKKDFDDKHSAGEPLDDIVKLDYQSYYDYVKSGYTSYKDNPDYIDKTVDHYVLSFNSITADISKLMVVSLASPTSFAGVKFDSAPAEPGEYTFTLEMTTNGETLKTEFTHTFE